MTRINLGWLPCLCLLLCLTGCAASSDPALQGLPRGLQIITEDEFFDIEGETVAAIRTSLRQNGPTLHGRTVAGLASWRVSYEYDTEFAMGECRMDRVEVFLHVTLTLPRWQPPSDADSVLVGYWNTYQADLSEHEEGHRAIAIEQSKSLTRELWKLRAFDCSEMNTRVRDQYQVFYDDFVEQQNTYDRVYKPIYWPPRTER